MKKLDEIQQILKQQKNYLAEKYGVQVVGVFGSYVRQEQRLVKLAGRRLTAQGVLVIEARQYRSQERNRQAALQRLVTLVQKACEPPKPRHKTRPTPAARLRRLESKRKRSEIKRMRRDAGIGG